MKRSLGLIALFLSLWIGTETVARQKVKKTRKVEENVAALNLSQVPLPEDQEVCFSPEEACDLKLLKLVDSAKESIDVAIYDINLPALVSLLIEKSKTTKVRIVADQRQSKGEHSRLNALIDAGAAVRLGHQKGIFHNKFVIIDNSLLETGSFNFTRHASTANQENQVYLTSPKVLVRYHKKFEQIWEDAHPPKAQKARERLTPGGTEDEN